MGERRCNLNSVDRAGSRWSAGVMDEERNDDGDEAGTGHGVTDFGSTRPSSRCVHRFVIDIHPPIIYSQNPDLRISFSTTNKFRLTCKRQSRIGERGERGRTVGMLVNSSLVISGFSCARS